MEATRRIDFETETERCMGIMEKNKDIMEKKALDDGFAPMEMVYGGKGTGKWSGVGISRGKETG